MDLKRTIARVTALAEDADDPFVALRDWLSRRSPPVPVPVPRAAGGPDTMRSGD
jgi:hypothetical protein